MDILWIDHVVRGISGAGGGFLRFAHRQSPRNYWQGDFNYDNLVDVADLGIVGTNWQVYLAPPARSARKNRGLGANSGPGAIRTAGAGPKIGPFFVAWLGGLG